MHSTQNTSKRVGILGGGQLSKMLAEAAIKMGHDVYLLVESLTDPAVKAIPSSIHADHVIVGKLSDPQSLQAVLAAVDVCAIESEFVDCDAIASSGFGSKVVPALQAIRLLQNKENQKIFLNEQLIPTSQLFRLPETLQSGSALNNPDAVERGIDWAVQLATARPVVFKWAEMGYDGKGTLLPPNTTSKETTEQYGQEIRNFITSAFQRGIRVYAESKVQFVRELAMVAVRNDKTNQFAWWPLVISEQHKGICKTVQGPAIALGVSPELQDRAVAIMRKIAENIDPKGIAGTFAVEFFETKNSELLVNEIAPRVHNSGHYTQHACAPAGGVSQFENHWQALTGNQLSPTDHQPYFAMVNLLGPDKIRPLADTPATRPAGASGVELYWYEKVEIRPWRKLGHINCAATSLTELTDKLALCRRIEQQWHQKCLAAMI